jgi:hypothetical protein
MSNPWNNGEKRTPLIPKSPRAPYRDYGFDPPTSEMSSNNLYSFAKDTSSDSTYPADLSLLSDTLQRLDAEIESDVKNGIIKNKPENKISNLELLSGAMQKIAVLENRLKEANQRAFTAERKLADANYLIQKRSDSIIDIENRELRIQIEEMEQFLADYGLIWVGNTDSSSDTDSGEHRSDEEDLFDWKTIVRNVNELNQISGLDEIETKMKNGAKQLVRKTAELKLELYSDGIMLGNGPFRSIAHCRIFLQDLQDGFYPAELQSKYPDGVIFDLTDKHTEKFSKMFPGVGQRIKDPPVLNFRDPTLIKTEDIINMVPQTSSSDLSFSYTRPKSSTVLRSSESAGPKATLRVKNFEGTNHIIKLRYCDTIATLRLHLTPIAKTDNYKIMTYGTNQGWAPIENENDTLSALNLTPRAALQLMKCAPDSKSKIISKSIAAIQKCEKQTATL